MMAMKPAPRAPPPDTQPKPAAGRRPDEDEGCELPACHPTSSQSQIPAGGPQSADDDGEADELPARCHLTPSRSRLLDGGPSR
jgi:hypothetical protein